MDIKFVDVAASTQEALINLVKNGDVRPPFMLVASRQTDGIGSRGNEWKSLDGNLFASFCIGKDALPGDIFENSLSIYFSMIMREVLRSAGSNAWVKWPNDFYINERKIGGTLTSKVGEIYVCGIGLNIVRAPKNAGTLDINITIPSIVGAYSDLLESKPSWKFIFGKFKEEFYKSKTFRTHGANEKVSLSGAILLDDGSLSVNGERIFSLR